MSELPPTKSNRALWIIVAALAGGVIISSMVNEARSKSSGPSERQTHRLVIETCDEDGATGTFVNTGGNTGSWELWVKALDSNNRMMDRDADYVIDLAAGAREIVSFSWVLDARPARCEVDVVTRRG